MKYGILEFEGACKKFDLIWGIELLKLNPTRGQKTTLLVMEMYSRCCPDGWRLKNRLRLSFSSLLSFILLVLFLISRNLSIPFTLILPMLSGWVDVED